MKRFVCLTIGLCLVMTGLAQSEPKKDPPKQEPPKQDQPKQEPKKDDAAKAEAKPGRSKEATEILKKADDATKKVESVRYTGTFKGVGDLEAKVPKIKGTYVLAGKKTSQGLGKYRIEVKITMPGSSEERDVIVGSDGDKYWLVDHKNKTVHQDIDPSVLGSLGGMIGNSAFREFVHPEPFGDEVNAVSQDLRGTKDVAGEKCHEINVKYGAQPGESLWFISDKDSLPRRVDRTNQGFAGTVTAEISELSVNPKFVDDPFKLTVPEGYKQTDDPPKN